MIIIAANILVVDDSMMQVKVMQTILEKEGYNVFVSNDGVDILKIMIDNKIDILLLDIVLPKTDGVELLEIILNCEETKEVPVIMVTALTAGQSVKKTLDMGAFDYIKKPIEPIEIIARVHSALRMKSKQDLLREYAVRDNLTKLYNRAYFDKTMPKLIENVDTYEKGIAFAMMDCDSFKKINDTYGHVAGDMVLSSVANAIDKSVKSTDMVCRYGGDEFCFALLNTSFQEGLIVCERVRNNTGKIKFVFNEDEVHITVSIGLAHLRTKGRVDVKGFIEEADQALYEAKRNGRNRVEIFKGDIY